MKTASLQVPQRLPLHRLLAAFALVMLASGCASLRPQASPTPAAGANTAAVVSIPGTEIVGGNRAIIRSGEALKAYPVNRYVDPLDPDVMHEGHVVYRKENAASWNLAAPDSALPNEHGFPAGDPGEPFDEPDLPTSDNGLLPPLNTGSRSGGRSEIRSGNSSANRSGTRIKSAYGAYSESSIEPRTGAHSPLFDALAEENDMLSEENASLKQELERLRPEGAPAPASAPTPPPPHTSSLTSAPSPVSAPVSAPPPEATPTPTPNPSPGPQPAVSGSTFAPAPANTPRLAASLMPASNRAPAPAAVFANGVLPDQPHAAAPTAPPASPLPSAPLPSKAAVVLATPATLASSPMPADAPSATPDESLASLERPKLNMPTSGSGGFRGGQETGKRGKPGNAALPAPSPAKRLPAVVAASVKPAAVPADRVSSSGNRPPMNANRAGTTGNLPPADTRANSPRASGQPDASSVPGTPPIAALPPMTLSLAAPPRQVSGALEVSLATPFSSLPMWNPFQPTAPQSSAPSSASPTTPVNPVPQTTPAIPGKTTPATSPNKPPRPL